MRKVKNTHCGLGAKLRRHWLRLAVAFLLSAQAIMLGWSATRHSPTLLEPAHLVAGLSHWEFGRYELFRVNPPLVRMVAALPVMTAGYEFSWNGFYEYPGARPVFEMGTDFVAANGERSIQLFTLARWACIPFVIIGGVFSFLFSRDLWQSDQAGLLTLTIWCFDPNILAHGELITNDVACTSFGLGATWAFWRWLRLPTWRDAVVAGLLLGLAELTKCSWLILLGLWPMLWCLSSHQAEQNAKHKRRIWPFAVSSFVSDLKTDRRTRLQRRLREGCQLAMMLLVAMYILNLGYGFDGCCTRLADFDFVSASLNGLQQSGVVGNRFRESLLGEIPVPFPKQYVLGVDVQKYDFESWGSLSYLRGEWKTGGWWYYYAYCLWVKVPHGVQLLVVLSGLRLIWWRVTDKSRVGQESCGEIVNCRSNSDTALIRLPTATQTACHQPCLHDITVLFGPSIVLFALASWQATMNEHFRYVLPILGPTFVFIGSVGKGAVPCSGDFADTARCSPD
jgi:hypothetical protein